MGKKKVFRIAALCTVVSAIAIASTGAVGLGNDSSAPDSGESTAGEAVSVFVKTESPVIGDITLTSEYIGKVEPGRQVIVYPKAAGEVLIANFQVGDTINAGDVLCEIDSQAFRTTIAQTQAAIASAQAKANYSLASAETDLATIEFNVENGYDASLNGVNSAVTNAEAAVKSAENRLDSANASLKSARRALRELRDDDIYPPAMMGMNYEQAEASLRDSVVQAELGVDAALLGLEQAKEGLETAKKSAKSTDVLIREQQESALTRVRMAELNTNLEDQYIAIQKMQDDLKNYTVTAPIDGVIEQRNIDPYDMASPQMPVYTISNKDIMMVVFNVPSSVAGNLQIGDRVDVRAGSAEYTGSVTEIGTQVNSVGLFPVKVQVTGDSSFMTGLTVTVKADTQQTLGAITLPLGYVYFKENEAYVYAAENGKAVKKPITVGLMDDKTVEVLSGIDTTTQIISTWSPDLKDGVPVQVTRGE